MEMCYNFAAAPIKVQSGPNVTAQTQPFKTTHVILVSVAQKFRFPYCTSVKRTLVRKSPRSTLDSVALQYATWTVV